MYLIDGKKQAADLTGKIAQRTHRFKEIAHTTPRLVVILVGDDPASHVYVRNKEKKAESVGFSGTVMRLPDHTDQETLARCIHDLNTDSSVHGILLQLPLPPHLNALDLITQIDPRKDVDGQGLITSGRLSRGLPCFTPCTPLGCLILLQETLPHLGRSLSGSHAVIVGRSGLVGKPLAQLLLNHDCTVTVVHSRTVAPQALACQADILISAVGQPNLITTEWTRPECVVIDVGTNRLPPASGETKGRLVGDVDFDTVAPNVAAITPVPGGVGPMTVACLLSNTLDAACLQTGTNLDE